jgi:hypothetical protein
MDNKKYTCKICNKDYKTYKSMWHHKNKYHNDIPEISPIEMDNIPISSPNNTLNIPLISPNTFKKTEQRVCNYCNKELSSYKNLHRHLQICKMKEAMIKENEELKKINEIKDKEIVEMKKSFEELKKIMLGMMNKKCKMHPKTLQKMINNTNSNNTINMTINNNIQYVELGDEELNKVFSKKEKMKILCCLSPMDKIIKHTHLNNDYSHNNNNTYKRQPSIYL